MWGRELVSRRQLCFADGEKTNKCWRQMDDGRKDDAHTDTTNKHIFHLSKTRLNPSVNSGMMDAWIWTLCETCLSLLQGVSASWFRRFKSSMSPCPTDIQRHIFIMFIHLKSDHKSYKERNCLFELVCSNIWNYETDPEKNTLIVSAPVSRFVT